MMTLFAFIITLAILVVVHEFGHFQVARWCGVKVLKYSFGFGKPIYAKKMGRDQTDFLISALPLGGYVKMLDEREGEVSPEEAHRAFNRRPVAWRMAIVAAGPLANLLLAVLLYAMVHWLGVNEALPVLASPVTDSPAAHAGVTMMFEILCSMAEDVAKRRG